MSCGSAHSPTALDNSIFSKIRSPGQAVGFLTTQFFDDGLMVKLMCCGAQGFVRILVQCVARRAWDADLYLEAGAGKTILASV